MKKSTKPILLCFMFLIATVITAAAQQATLSWDPNTEPEVVGYNVYYRTDTATFPFNGTTLPEGASPITILGSDATALTVDLPDDGSIYYFTATAISDSGLESNFSEIIASEWIPYLLSPTNNVAVDTASTFTWDLPPTGYNVTYELHYGTDPNLQANATVITPPGAFKSGWPQVEWSLAIPLALLFSLLMTIRSQQKKCFWRPVRIGLCVGLFVLQVSCGSGGGDTAPVADPIAPVTDPTAPATTPLSSTVVSGISTTSYQVNDLQPGTEYYWKIVAVDDTGYLYESLTQTFTTLNN
jgi:hypothetical protein